MLSESNTVNSLHPWVIHLVPNSLVVPRNTLVVMLPGQVVILLVEDREDDILLIRRALRQAKVYNRFSVVRSGEEAFAYFNGSDRYANRIQYPFPDLILLDLKMPGMDGFEVLRIIRTTPAFKAIRVIV